MLLAHDLEIALLKALEVKSDIPSEEIQAILNRFDFSHYELHHFQWVSLFVNLLNNLWLFNQNRVDKGHKLVLKSLTSLKELAVEKSGVINVQ